MQHKIGNIIQTNSQQLNIVMDWFYFQEKVIDGIPNLILDNVIKNKIIPNVSYTNRLKGDICWTYNNLDYLDFEKDLECFQKKCISKYLNGFDCQPTKIIKGDLIKIGKVGYYLDKKTVKSVDLDLMDCLNIDYKIRHEIPHIAHHSNFKQYLLFLLN